MNPFTLFTTDVKGQMRPLPARDHDRYTVIPSGEPAGLSISPDEARALLDRMARLAQAAKAPARTQRKAPVMDSSVSRLDRAIDTLEHSAGRDRAAELAARSASMRSRPIPDAPGAGPSPWELMAGPVLSAGELDAQRAAAVDQEQVCREAEAAYAARNPHKAGGYLNEDKVARPAKYFADAAPAGTFETRCREAEAAYAARNPHKKKEVQP